LKEGTSNKLRKFQKICKTIRTEGQKALQRTQLEFYEVMTVPMLTYASENWIKEKQGLLK
jgi:hypothetical protein